jgi:hypothetical protein
MPRLASSREDRGSESCAAAKVGLGWCDIGRKSSLREAYCNAARGRLQPEFQKVGQAFQPDGQPDIERLLSAWKG